MSLILLTITCIGAYVTATYVIETISISCAVRQKSRQGTLFGIETYKSKQEMEKFNSADASIKDSPYYIREKIELGMAAEDHGAMWVKVMIMTILTIYMYGAMSLKYVSGAESFIEAISFIKYKDSCQMYRAGVWGIDPYFIGIIVFGALSLAFSFGNIENAKILQIVTSILRLIAILMMYAGSFYYIAKDGVQAAPVFDFKNQISNIGTVFGNTVFIFIYHHSISGIIYPIRPQSSIKKMLIYSHIIGYSLLSLLGVLAFIAFSGI